jgi:Protein of unknown function (DUF3024)
MAIPAHVRDDAAAALTEFCREHSAESAATQQHYEFQILDNYALLIEKRPSFVNPSESTSRSVAKFRYSEARNIWSLYWSDAGGKKWNRVSNTKTASNIRDLLKVVVKDPDGVFWA